MLRLLRVRNHVLDGGRRLGAQLDQAHGEARRLSGHGVVLVEVELELLVDIGAVRAHGRQAEAEAPAVPDLLVAALLDLLQQVLCDLAAVVGVDESERVQAAALGVPGTVGGVLRKVALHERERPGLVAAVDDAQTGRRRELRPISGASQPVEVVPKRETERTGPKNVNIINLLSKIEKAGLLCS